MTPELLAMQAYKSISSTFNDKKKIFKHFILSKLLSKTIKTNIKLEINNVV